MIIDENTRKIFTYAVIALVALVAILISASVGFDKGVKHQIERSYNVKKEIPIDPVEQKPFQPKLDYERITNAVAKVGDANNPKDYRVFSQSVKQIHGTILEFLSEKLGLTEEEQQSVLEHYNEYHEGFAGDYYKQLTKLNKSTFSDKEKSFVTYDTVQSVGNLSSILSSNICNLAGFILTLATTQSKYSSPMGMFLGKPCQFLLSKALNPIVRELKRLAVIKDLTVSKISLRKHIREMIVEMGTVKDSFRTVIDEEYILKLILGLESRANFSLHVKSIVKAGFKLDKFFKLEFDHETKEIVLTLPEPEILSNEIDARVMDMENGWFVKIDKDKINRVNRKARQWSYDVAIESGILKNAKKNAGIILKTIFQPIVMAMDPDYKISIRFKSSDDEGLKELPDDLKVNEKGM